MRAIRKAWASFQDNATFMRRLHGWLTVFWIVMIPLSYELGWLDSVTFVSALSLWALVSAHWSTWQAARVEVAQQQQAQELIDDPVEDRVVRKLVVETDVDLNGASEDPPLTSSRAAPPRSA